MRRTAFLLATVVLLAGCLAPFGQTGCPGMETTSANFLLPVRLPEVAGWYWTIDERLPLHVQDPLLPWPGVFLNEVHFSRARGDAVHLAYEDGAKVRLSYGTSERGHGQSATERAWLQSFADRAMNISDGDLQPLLDEYGLIHQGGGPPQYHQAWFDSRYLDLDKLWNATKPRFEKIGGSSGNDEECIGSLCFAGADVEWYFGWVHNADWSLVGGMTQVAVPSGWAVRLNGPFIQMTPWGAVQVTLPGHNETEVREVATSWLGSKGLPAPGDMEITVFGCRQASEWPATTDVEDLNANAPFQTTAETFT